MPQDDLFFVRIEEPDKMRRAILESIKNTIQSLRRFDAVKKIRTEKAKETLNLKNQVQDLQRLAHQLHSFFPEVKGSEEKPPAMMKEQKRPAMQQPDDAGSDVTRLEIQLRRIEEKLRGLEQ